MRIKAVTIQILSCHNCPQYVKSIVGPPYCGPLKEYTGGRISAECPLPDVDTHGMGLPVDCYT